MALDVTMARSDGTATIVLRGELDASTASRVSGLIDSAAALRLSRLVLDMSALAYMSSAGLRILILARRALGPGVPIHIVGAAGPVLETIRMSGMDRSLVVVGHESGAPAASAQGPGSMPAPLTLPGTLESLEHIGAYIRDATTVAGVAPKALYGLRLAVDEIVTNIVTHGYREAGRSGELTIAAAVDGDSFVLTVEDSGAHYDPRTRAAPTEADIARPLEDREVGGLGIFLALRSVERFDYHRVGGRNRSIFVVKRHQAK